MSALTLTLRRRRAKLLPNAFGERVTVVVVELRCPQCRRWTAIEDGAMVGAVAFRCPTLACPFTLRYDFQHAATHAKEV